MSLTRDHGNIVFECNECGETLDTEESEFGEAWEEARSEGWRAFEVGGEWHHNCGDCA